MICVQTFRRLKVIILITFAGSNNPVKQRNGILSRFCIVESDLDMRSIAKWLVLGTAASAESEVPISGCFFASPVNEGTIAFHKQGAVLHDLDLCGGYLRSTFLLGHLV